VSLLNTTRRYRRKNLLYLIMMYLLDVLLEHLQIHFVALVQWRHREMRAYVAPACTRW